MGCRCLYHLVAASIALACCAVLLACSAHPSSVTVMQITVMKEVSEPASLSSAPQRGIRIQTVSKQRVTLASTGIGRSSGTLHIIIGNQQVLDKLVRVLETCLTIKAG